VSKAFNDAKASTDGAAFNSVILVSTVLMFCGSSCGVPSAAADDAATLDAQRIFKQFVDLEHSYDPAQADLYASSAVIKDTRVYQDGPTKTFNWTGDNYKSIIKAQLPVQKARSEQFAYTQVSYAREGNNIRIKCTRTASQRKFSAPFELLLAPAGKQGYKIIEETFQSQP
jgi:hypothetical protein